VNLPNLQLKSKYALILVPLLLVSIGLAFAVYPLFHDQVYAGVMLEDQNVSGKTRTELIEMLHESNERGLGRTVSVYYGDQAYSIQARDVGFSIDVESTAAVIWNYGRVGSWWDRIQSIRTASNQDQKLPVRIVFDQEKLNAIVAAWKRQLEKQPQNATLSLTTGGIVPETRGVRLMEAELKTSLLRSFYHDGSPYVAMPMVAVEPKVTAESLRQAGIVVMQSIFSTQFNAEDVKRSINVKLAADKINGQILQPGETFSFNETVGPRDKASGFQEALEFFDGELVPGIGGGVCQVSSTIYNAALLANLDITERLNHGKPLSYIALGRDATVVYGVIDFKFVNSSNSPIMLMSEVQGNTLYAAIFGREKLKETIDIIITEQKEIPPVTVKKPDPELPAGETKIENKGAPGYELKVYRLVSRGGKVIKREFLSKDQYMADNIIIKVGVKPKPVALIRDKK
jgi:vancomycin resistance protein YoaR